MRNLSSLFFFLLLFPSIQVTHAQVLIRDLVSIGITSQDRNVDRRTRFGMSRNVHLFTNDIAFAKATNCTSPGAGFPEGIRWNPSRNGNKFINYDELYAQTAQRNLVVLHGAAPFMHGGLYGKPLCETTYATLSEHALPVSYLSNAIRASLFAARYGSAPANGFPTDFETIAAQYVEVPDNQVGNGNGTVDYVEIFNEADGIFLDDPAVLPPGDLNLYPSVLTNHYCAPNQYAAMLSAAYDGNGETDPVNSIFHFKDAAGDNISDDKAFWGIKNLSPSTKVVMAGLSDLRKDWLDEVVTQCQTMRPTGAPLPFDVVNYHFYSTTAHTAIGTTNWNFIYHGKDYAIGAGQFPEEPTIDLKVRLAKVLNEQDLRIQSLPTWITEFGYSEDLGATKQGQWLTRYILETSAVKVGSRGIDRLFIYDLNDDLSGNSGPYSFHGIQKADGTPKKSWYHLMTMLNVIGGSSYTRNNLPASNSPALEQFFLNTAPTVALPPDDPRIYLYSNATGGTYALWVPKGNGTTYPGKLKLNGTWTTKPKFQKIEVLEYDEDGKRTMIPDGDVDFTAGSPATVYIRNLTLTETPMYLRTVANAYSDVVVPPVLNLTASCFGCQRTELNWTNPVNSHYAFFRVYYAKVSEYGSNPAIFDLSNMHLYSEQLVGSATSIYVDLPVDEYYFWVIPFRNPYDISSLRRVTVSPDLQGTLTPADSYYAYFKAGACTAVPCVAPLTKSDITNLKIIRPDGTVLTTFGNSYFEEGFYEALIPSPTADLCGEMNGTVLPPAPGILLVPNNPFTGTTVSFVVNFPTPQYLRAIQIYLQGGRAQISIEFMEDCCSAYYLAKKYEFSGVTPQWVTLNNSAPDKRIEKVRITIKAAQIGEGGGVAINRLLFCTSPALDRCPPGGTTSAEVTVVPPSGIQATNINTHSATISFWPATRTMGGDETVGEEPVYQHTLRYGIALDAQGQIIQPQEISTYGSGYDKEVEQQLSKLASNTTYIVDVIPNVACNDKDHTGRIIFTTASEKGKERTMPATLADDQVRLFPNPVADVLHLDVPVGKYSSWRILSIDGQLLRSGSMGTADNAVNVNVQDLPPGIHVVTLFQADGKPWTKGFLKAQ